MFKDFKNFPGTTKALIIGLGAAVLVTVGVVVAVLATGGLTNPF